MVQVNTSPNTFKSSKEYVCWIDIMGTKNTMSESFQKAANFILKFHSCVIDAVKRGDKVTFYPLMDGVFITSPNSITIKKVIDTIFSSVAKIFLSEEKNGYRFIVKGSLAFGDIAHGININKEVCEKLSTEENYKQSLMCGMPMIQAFTAEHTAPPFGIYIHESARTPSDLQGKYYAWSAHADIDKNVLKEKILSYFNWCNYYHRYLELDPTKIELYKKLTIEYFTNRMSKDSENNPWN